MQNGVMELTRHPVAAVLRARVPKVVKLRAFWTKLTKTSFLIKERYVENGDEREEGLREERRGG